MGIIPFMMILIDVKTLSYERGRVIHEFLGLKAYKLMK